jgi:large subunit ribosomal protein L17
MRHGDKVNNLGRTTSHRHALLRNLAIALFTHKRIFTTLAKAKALRGFVEPLITKSKTDSTHSRRLAFSYLNDKEAVKELFGTIAAKVGDRPGGYTRVIKTGFRAGDAAEMAMIEMVDFNEIYTQNKTAAKSTEPKKKTRRSGGAKAEGTATKKAAAPKAKKADKGTDTPEAEA